MSPGRRRISIVAIVETITHPSGIMIGRKEVVECHVPRYGKAPLTGSDYAHHTARIKPVRIVRRKLDERVGCIRQLINLSLKVKALPHEDKPIALPTGEMETAFSGLDLADRHLLD